jgi:hypothetical protein
MKIILDSITFVPLIETSQNNNMFVENKRVKRPKLSSMYLYFIVMHIYVLVSPILTHIYIFNVNILLP